MDLSVIYGIVIIIVLLLLSVLLYYNNHTTLPLTYMDPLDTNTFPFKTFIINLDINPERYQYISEQLNNLGIFDFERWPAVHGSKISTHDMISEGVNSHLAQHNKGGAGCSLSHIRLWRHILSQKLGWTLILEDDAYFHPQFLQLFPHYWSQVPTDAKIVYLGYCGDHVGKHDVDAAGVICSHAYMISWVGANYLLSNIVPMKNTLDGSLLDHFQHRRGSYVFNGDIVVDGVRPDDYKNQQGCHHGGIVYQNQGEFPSMIVAINDS